MKVTERLAQVGKSPVFLCDYSPPRGASLAYLEPARSIDADFISVAYNPGRAVRVSSVAMASALKKETGREVTFSLATRDMNKLAVQSNLLGAQMLGLENVIVIAGDPFSERELSLAAKVMDYQPTGLIESIVAMNEGTDYKGSKLREPTDFCIGASIDLARGPKTEARLARRKAEASAHFFITQPIFDPREAEEFWELYREAAGAAMTQPVFWGLQILEQDGVIFSNVPQQVRQELEEGRSGIDIALELLARLVSSGIQTIYLVPPIRRGGARNYEAAQELLAEARRLYPEV